MNAAPNAFRRRPAELRPRFPGSSLLSAVRSSGAVWVDAEDPIRRTAAAKLAVVGIVAVEEVGVGGILRALSPADVLMANSLSRWRVSLA
jgi:hypothetical protein